MVTFNHQQVRREQMVHRAAIRLSHPHHNKRRQRLIRKLLIEEHDIPNAYVRNYLLRQDTKEILKNAF